MPDMWIYWQGPPTLKRELQLLRGRATRREPRQACKLQVRHRTKETVLFLPLGAMIGASVQSCRSNTSKPLALTRDNSSIRARGKVDSVPLLVSL